ncbi:MAG: hypothetical protein C0501_30960 [Isosphaera sp.]|nr:hypothetical protein [Isosphaera sp.]
MVQITDEAGFGSAGGLTTFGGTDLGIERFGPNGSRTVSEQWGTDAVGDPRDVKALQDLYRVALGLTPLPDPEAVALLKRGRPAAPKSGGGKSSDGTGDSDGGDGRVPVEVVLRDVPPPGWFGVGGKRDVPADACYVGRTGTGTRG